MSDQSLYDDDILLWSEQQAEIIRKLGRTRRDLSNELDIENVAEEIESVGRSELAAVKSFVRQIFLHLIKLAAEPNAEAARHWRSEIVAYHSEIIDRYAPSMRHRIDIDQLWRSAPSSRAWRMKATSKCLSEIFRINPSSRWMTCWSPGSTASAWCKGCATQ